MVLINYFVDKGIEQAALKLKRVNFAKRFAPRPGCGLFDSHGKHTKTWFCEIVIRQTIMKDWTLDYSVTVYQ